MPGKTTDGYNSNVTVQDKADNAKSDMMNVFDIKSKDLSGNRAVNGVPVESYDHNVTHRPPANTIDTGDD